MDETCNVPDVSKRIVNWNSGIPERIDNTSCDSGDTGIGIASQDVIDETNELYIYHLARRIAEMGLTFPLENREYVTLPQNASSLQKWADKFIISPQRIWVYEQAQNVNLDTLDIYTFKQLLFGLLPDDGIITWEEVLILFYFCTDLSIRALQEKVTECFIRIYNWTTFYLSSRLSVWVEEQGGWCVILQSSASYATRLSILGFGFISALAICMYIKNK